MKAKDDPTITRIREARHRISEDCGHDLQKIVEYYVELQKKYQERIINATQQETTPGEPAKVFGENHAIKQSRR
jgi:thymidylate kinase